MRKKQNAKVPEMTGDDITDIEYNTLLLALGKCRMLSNYTQSGEFKLCVLAKDRAQRRQLSRGTS